ncbi:MAG: ABC transporter substrate-binding protein [Hyphomicrobiales bacterium]|nr:ABC transporter substrate-binding protein [Hyphomicrobiales bacterium]
MAKLKLSLAMGAYDHIADLVSGRVAVEGIELNCLTYRVEEIFFRTIMHRDFDVSELSMAKYVSMVSQGDNTFVALPVFPSRVPRHSSIYVRRDGPVKTPADLNGKKIGLPEWAQTAAVYSRGMLAKQYGVDLAGVDWIQAGVEQAGRIEKVKLNLPQGLRITPRLDGTLNAMLLSGEIDAVLSATPLSSFSQGHPNVRRLFEDFLDAEMKYVAETGIFPIMHTVVVRRQLVDANRWIAMNLFTAFEEAKNRSVARALFSGTSAYPIPWAYEHARRAKNMFGGELWPYGIQPNRRTLDAFLEFCHDQGISHRRIQAEELFAPQVQDHFRA